ncbi:MAG: cardiolipin synthase [Marinobacter sp.]|uniref:cardiolipin synthase n=1 Tax=Marinobacter sp. TaxID=50741 RepID=UPI00299DD548|nr:cardiolipin synthase [Marinobacter sp.]MDX1633185.1 cardiolipin synthase [Marinobacter sp.]
MTDIPLLLPALAIVYSLAIFCVYRVLLSYRTAQGAIAWIAALLGFPFLALPLFVLFGRNRFSGYVKARRLGDQSLNHLLADFEQQAAAIPKTDREGFSDELRVLTALAKQPFTTGNRCDLLKDGKDIFDALFDAMEDAREYILLEFYIVRSDRVGQRIKSILKRKLADGVQVYFLYDDIGSFQLPRRYLTELAQAGAQVSSFGNGNVRRRRLQMNFRNHRKLLVCDGRVGFVGGINLGDEYLGTDIDQGPWRDTHCRVTGPAVLGLQLAWLEDWNWANDTLPSLNWQAPEEDAGDQDVLILPTGPADPFETCTLFFLNCINNARKRIWITSPYFVPDFQVVNALQLAALRGVDVRIIIPEKSDHRLIRLAAYSYLVQASRAGIGIYRYQPGFMHQKLVLVDDRYAAVGTANLDNRSMRLNFEITALSTGSRFVQQVHVMLSEDLKACRQMTERDYRDRSLAFRLTCRAVRLLAPLL